MTNTNHISAFPTVEELNDPAVQRAAQALYQASEAGVPCEPVRQQLPSKSVRLAYAVQELNSRRALLGGRKLVGRKIGLTSKSVQSQIGIDQPDYGLLFADMERIENEPIAISGLIQPKIEGEIAFVLKRDLTEDQLTTTQVRESIAYAVPAIEVVDSRIADWNIDIVDTIADNASSGVYLLGRNAVPLDRIDLGLCGMVIERNGDPVSFGAGAACLGHPLTSVQWLARKMVEVNRPLLAGDVVLSGALGPMVVAKKDDCFELRVSGLGSVTAEFR
jgi:2-keto-4-pentenoate hydratase